MWPGDFLDDIKKELQDLFGHTIGDNLLALLQSIHDVGDELGKKVTDSIEGAFTSVGDKLAGLTDGLLNTIDTNIKKVGDLVSGIEANIKSTIDLAYATAERIEQGIVDSVTSAISNMADSVYQAITDATDKIHDFIRPLWDAAVMEWHAFTTSVHDLITKGWGFVTDTLNDLGTRIIKGVEVEWQWVEDAYHKASGIVQSWINASWKWVTDTVRDIEKSVMVWWEWIDTNTIQPSLKWLQEEGIGVKELYESLQQTVWGEIEGNPLMPPFIRKIGEQKTFTAQILAALLDIGAVAIFVPQLLLAANTGNMALIAQGSIGESHAGLLSPDDIAEGQIRGIIPTDMAASMTFKAGLGDEEIAVLRGNKEKFMAVGDEISLFYRGEVPYDTLVSNFAREGISQHTTDKMIEAAKFIPSVSDMIRMLVREAFSPDISAKFGQYEDYPEKADALFHKIGLMPEWSKAYWASHWELPSLSAGYEMLHRGVITFEELQLLMRAQDVMPFWRKKLEQVSYDVITRVDARREYELGTIDEKKLLKRYMDMGYNEADATDLVVLEKAKVAHGQKDTGNNAKDIAKGQVDKALRDKFITDEDAVILYERLGYTKEAAEFSVALIEYERTMELQRREIDRLKFEYVAGMIPTDEMKGNLFEIGLDKAHVDSVFDDIAYEAIPKPKTPSLSDLEKFVTHGVIDDDIFITRVVNLGYTSDDATLYLQLAHAGKVKRNAKS